MKGISLILPSIISAKTGISGRRTPMFAIDIDVVDLVWRLVVAVRAVHDQDDDETLSREDVSADCIDPRRDRMVDLG